MPNLPPTERTITAVLECYRAGLCRLAHKDKAGAPPPRLYVEMWDRPSFGLQPPTVARKWHITQDAVTPLPLSSPVPDQEVVEPGRYRCVRGHFAFNDEGFVCIDWHVNPSYAPGFWYQPVEDESGRISLREIKPAPPCNA